MDKIRLAIVGCGGMGNRHFAGLVELTRAGLSEFDLVAVCDKVRESAEALARKAEEQLGKKPAVFEKLAELASAGIQAVDVVTVPESHHTVAVEALQRGWHVMLEKPMGLTVRACKLILEAAGKSKSVLSVAENFHCDPINLLGRELLRTGAIGAPRFMIHNHVGGGTNVIATPWRHLKRGGGPLLDVGVHSTYITEYFMGEVDTVYAQARFYEKIRRTREGVAVEANAEDAVYATFLFRNGAVAQYIEDHAGRGQGLFQRVIYGSKGSIGMPGDRSGKPITLSAEGNGTISDEHILDFIPGFRFDRFTAALFGGERIWQYQFPFPETDRKLLALEYGDFSECILKGRAPQVDPRQAARAVGLTYTMLESSKLGRAVTMEEIMSEKISAYQDEINRSIGLGD